MSNFTFIKADFPQLYEDAQDAELIPRQLRLFFAVVLWKIPSTGSMKMIVNLPVRGRVTLIRLCMSSALLSCYHKVY